MKNLIGLDIGGTKCAVIFGKEENGNLNIIEKQSFLTETQKGPDHALNMLYDGIESVLAKYKLNSSDIAKIGISCGGPLDSKTGIIMSPPNLPGWDNIHIVEVLQKRFKIKADIQNDANACALAEWKFGAGRGTQNMIFMTFGTGLGAGLIIDGRLFAGTNDMAGEVGHIRLEEDGPVGYGKAGSFEGFCSGGGIAQLAKVKTREALLSGIKVSFCSSLDDLDAITAQSVADAALKGDELAIEIYRISGTYLGKGLSILIDILNPELIVIGSIFTRVPQLLEPYAMEVIRKETISHSRKVCEIKPAILAESLGDIAALSVAAYE